MSHGFHCFELQKMLTSTLPELPQLPYLEVLTPYSVFMIFPQLITLYFNYLFMSLDISTRQVVPWGRKNVLVIHLSFTSFKFSDIRNVLTRGHPWWSSD